MHVHMYVLLSANTCMRGVSWCLCESFLPTVRQHNGRHRRHPEAPDRPPYLGLHGVYMRMHESLSPSALLPLTVTPCTREWCDDSRASATVSMATIVPSSTSAHSLSLSHSRLAFLSGTDGRR
jgi:hypothetical protein